MLLQPFVQQAQSSNAKVKTDMVQRVAREFPDLTHCTLNISSMVLAVTFPVPVEMKSNF